MRQRRTVPYCAERTPVCSAESVPDDWWRQAVRAQASGMTAGGAAESARAVGTDRGQCRQRFSASLDYSMYGAAINGDFLDIVQARPGPLRLSLSSCYDRW